MTVVAVRLTVGTCVVAFTVMALFMSRFKARPACWLAVSVRLVAITGVATLGCIVVMLPGVQPGVPTATMQ
jgi:hypothetical protein